MTTYPSNFKYTKDHEWAERLPTQAIRIGITDHAQAALGDIVFVELPAVGKKLKAGEAFGVVESIKAVSDLYAPIGGTVKSINTPLTNEPAKLNTDSHGDAWLIEIQPDSPAEWETLMSSEKYTDFVQKLR